ncbi:hypothetical protein QBC38DRAFT_418470 [Podospora fimiseda]|uniref:Uncharacterized protein n=1 Tax=Podospora fimiseda TaxID=252190 RepID=A0AAN7BNQ2_9PEZI|nr:hypothetical protein QBC38DRAFT_418470 [Podospora fimiseda]
MARAQGSESSQKYTPVDKFIAIGIDFGTTYSGVSWASSEAWANSQQNIIYIHDVMNWPQEAGHMSEVQVPTLIDPDQPEKWGMLCLPAGSNPIKWLKLLLLNEADLIDDVKMSKQFEDARRRLVESKEYGFLGVVGLIAQFLEHIWRHALKKIANNYEGPLNLPLKVAIGVPAMWKPEIKERMKRAAILAGITDTRYGAGGIGHRTTLCFVEEPEAAAAWTLREQSHTKSMIIGDSFIVCDCGGGTVDAITYVVKSTAPFRAQAGTQGRVGLCGGFLIDQAFVAYLKSSMVSQKFKFSRCSDEEFRIFFNSQWDWTLKRELHPDNFTPEPPKNYPFTPPAGALSLTWKDSLRLKRTGETPKLWLERGVVKRFFNDTVKGVQLLIDQQLDLAKEAGLATPRDIFVVGGLGGSEYLRHQLELLHDIRAPENLRSPKNSWSAVARGAVLMLLEEGISPALDPQLNRNVIFSGKTELGLKMAWNVNEGQSTDKNAPEPQDFYLDFDKTDQEGLNVKVHVNVSYHR